MGVKLSVSFISSFKIFIKSINKMKKIISIVNLTTVVVGGLVFSFTQFNNGSVANREIKTEAPKKAI